jgi:uncharacterized protein with PIN domain
MAPVNRLDASRASASTLHSHQEPNSDSYDLIDIDDELKRLSAATQELLGQFREPGAEMPAPAPVIIDPDEFELLRMENDDLKARIQELETAASGKGEQIWRERQKEYESLLEEKSEVIRTLHLKLQEIQESVNIGEAPVSEPPPSISASRIGQAEEILRLKRELEEQRQQLQQDEEDMMSQMRQMEMVMARERAEMARQRQEVQRLQADLAREIEQTSRDPELRERLNTLTRRTSPNLTAATAAVAKPAPETDQQKSSGFFRRIFGK